MEPESFMLHQINQPVVKSADDYRGGESLESIINQMLPQMQEVSIIVDKFSTDINLLWMEAAFDTISDPVGYNVYHDQSQMALELLYEENDLIRNKS
jgi:hypothetical protein